MDFDPTQIPILHENPMYHMEQNQRFQHICDIAVQITNVEKLLSSYIFTGDHLCNLMKDIVRASGEMEFICTNQNFGEILQSLDDFQESFKNHFKDIQSLCLMGLKNLVKKDFPDLIESKKTYAKNLEKYYQVQDHYLSLPKKSKTKVNKERTNEFQKAFTESATSFFEYVIRLDAFEAKISNLFGRFLIFYPKSFLNATSLALEKEIKLTEKIDSICPDYKSIEKRQKNCRKEFLSSIPLFFQKINSHYNPYDEVDNVNNSSSQSINPVFNSSENPSTASSFIGDSKSSSSQTLIGEQKIAKHNSSNQIFSIMNGISDPSSNKIEIFEKQGYLWKRCGKMTKTWERKYFVCNQGVLSYSLSVETATNPSNTIQLALASVQPNETEDRPYVFNLITQRKIYSFQAPSQLDFDEWVNAIQNGIASGLANYDNETGTNTNANNNSSQNQIELNSSFMKNDNVNNNNNNDTNQSDLSNTNSLDIPEMKPNCTFNNDQSLTHFPTLRTNSFPNETFVSHDGNNFNHSEFNFLNFSSVRRGSTINKKTNPNVNLASNSDSIPKIPSFTTTPPSSPNLSFSLCTCADCGAGRATWCIINRGLIICDNCSGIHRSIPKFSTVRSLKFDKIDKYNMKILSILSNNIMNAFIEATLLQSEDMSSSENSEIKRINNSSSPEERTEFIKKKYIEKVFIDPSFVLMTNKERKHLLKQKKRDEKRKAEEVSGSYEISTEKIKDKIKSRIKNKDKDDEKSEVSSDKKPKKNKNKDEVDNRLEVMSPLHSVGSSDSKFTTLNVNNDLRAEDDDLESLEARKHQGKRHHKQQATAARRRSFQNQLKSSHSPQQTQRPEMQQQHISEFNSSQHSSSSNYKKTNKDVVLHDVFEAIQTQDLFELMKIAFVGGLQEASLKGGFRPIHAAACVGNPVMIVVIIENDPDSIKHVDDKNWTALSYASYYNNEKAVDALLAYGASAASNDGELIDLSANPFVIAKEMNYEIILKKLAQFQVELPNDFKLEKIVPLNTDFVPQEIHQSMVIIDDVSSNQQSMKPMTDADMSQIQQALKNMSKRPRMRRKSVTDAHKNITNPDDY